MRVVPPNFPMISTKVCLYIFLSYLLYLKKELNARLLLTNIEM
jgi:hypothetical protein